VSVGDPGPGVQARGSGRSVRECQGGRNPSPQVKMSVRHATTNLHPRSTLPCSQTSAEPAVFCIVLIFRGPGLVASWPDTARSDDYFAGRQAFYPPRLHPVNATLAGAGYGHRPTSLTGSSFEFNANGQTWPLHCCPTTLLSCPQGLRHAGYNVSRRPY